MLAVLSAVPWLGYQFISEAKQFLDAGQLISQEQFGRSVANTFYNKKESLTLSLAEGAPLPKTYLATPMTVDGSKQDWQDQSYRKVSFPQRQFYDGFGFSVAMGERNNSLYGLIEVRDVDPDYATGSLNGLVQETMCVWNGLTSAMRLSAWCWCLSKTGLWLFSEWVLIGDVTLWIDFKRRPLKRS